MGQSRARDEQAVVESLIAGVEQYVACWQNLPADTYFAAWRAVNARALDVLAAITLRHLAQAQSAAGSADVLPWVARAIDATRTTELNADVLMQAWLVDQHDRGVQLGAGADPVLAVGGRRAVLGAQLMAGELDQDGVRVRQLTRDADPTEVREALVHLADALARELAELTGGSPERVLRSLVWVDK